LKYRLYTQKYLTNLSKDLAYQSYEQAYKTNPYFQADMDRKNLQFKYLQENNENLRFREEMNLKYLEFSNKKKAESPIGPVTNSALSTGQEAPTLSKLEDDYNLTEKTTKELGAKYGNILFPNEKFPNMSGKDKLKAMEKLVSDYRENPKMDLTSDQIKYLEQYRVLENELTDNLNLINSTKKESYKFLDQQGKDRLSKVGNLTIGNKTYNPTELYNINNQLQTYLSLTPKTPQGRQDKILYDNNREEMLNHFSELEGGKYLPLAESFAKKHSPLAIQGFQDREVNSKLEQVQDVTGDLFDKQQDFESKYISEHSPKYMTQRAAINMDDKNGKSRVDSFLAAKNALFNELGQLPNEKESSYDPGTVNSYLYGKDSKQTPSPIIEKGANGNNQLVVFSPKGEQPQIIPMTDKELQDFFPEAAQSSPVSGIVSKIRRSPGFTTNSANVRVDGNNDPSAAVNAYFSGYMLNNLKDSKYAPIVRMDVQGDPTNSGDSSTDGYDVILYVKDPKTNHWKSGVINKGGYIRESGVATILQNINPRAIEDAINQFN